MPIDPERYIDCYFVMLEETEERYFYYGVINWIITANDSAAQAVLDDALEWMEEKSREAYVNPEDLDARRERFFHAFAEAARIAYLNYEFILEDWANPEFCQDYTLEEVDVYTDLDAVLLTFYRVPDYDQCPQYGAVAPRIP